MSLERITLSGPAGTTAGGTATVTVDAGDERALSLVRDAATGRIRGILRDWEGELPAVLARTGGLDVETVGGLRALRPPR